MVPRWILPFLAASVTLWSGCGDDSTTPAGEDTGTTTGATESAATAADSGSAAATSSSTTPDDGTATGGSTTDDSTSSGGSTTASESTSTGADEACQDLELALQAVADGNQSSEMLVGLSVSVAAAGCEPWTAAWGNAELSPESDLTADHVLRVGSVTKTYTAALVLKLADEGLLMLDDTLQDWEIDVPSADQITLRQLLNHTSGLADYQNNEDWTQALIADPDREWDPQELIDFTVALPPIGAPGSGYAYSNANYVLAALVAELADGRTYAQALRARVLGPAGLEHTYVEAAETWDEPTAAGYLVVSQGPPQATVGQYHASAAWSAGAVVATAGDVRDWLSVLLTSDFLSPQSQGELVDFVLAPGSEGYGLGVFQIQVGDVTAVGHNGAVMGFQAAAFYDPGTNTAVAVLQNQIGVDAAGNLADDPIALAVALLQTVSEAR